MADMHLLRNTVLGISLETTLNSLVESSELSPDVKDRISENFSRAFTETLEETKTDPYILKGSLLVYQKLSRVWNLWVKNAILVSPRGHIRSPLLKITATELDSVNHEEPSKKAKIGGFK